MKKEITAKKYSPYGINGSYYVYDNEDSCIPMGYGSVTGTRNKIKQICDELNEKDESKEVKEGGDWCYDGNESESYTLLYNGKPMVDMSTGEDEAIELVSLLNEKEAQSKNMYYQLRECAMIINTIGNGNYDVILDRITEVLKKANPNY